MSFPQAIPKLNIFSVSLSRCKAIMTVLSVKQVRALGDGLQRDPLQHANHAVSLLNCIKGDSQEVGTRLRSC